MNDPTPESLALVEDEPLFMRFLTPAEREDVARKYDAYVAERTAGLNATHLAHMNRVDEANERCIAALKGQIATLRIVADAMADSVEYAEDWGAVRGRLRAYRAVTRPDADPCKIRVDEAAAIEAKS